jgi:hypothetical protein
MNELMKLKIEREIWPQCISNVTTDTGKLMKNYFDKYKFAELIVQECIDSVLDSSVEYTTRPQLASEIKEHFGVEE